MEIDDLYEYPGYYATGGQGLPTAGMTFAPDPAQNYITPSGIAYDPISGEEKIAMAGMPTAMVPAVVGPAVKAGSKFLPKLWSQLWRIFPWLATAGYAGYEVAEELNDQDPFELFGGGMDMIPRTSSVNLTLGNQFGGGVMQQPPNQIVVKSWQGIKTKNGVPSIFYLLTNGRVVVRKANGVMKLVKRPRMVHFKTSNPRLGDLAKAGRVIKKTRKALDKIKT